MALFVEQGDKLWTWAVDHFEGAALGFPVYWNPDLPTEGFDADHRFPYGDVTAFVRIRPSNAVGTSTWEAFELEWRCFVYEIHNLMNATDYSAACGAAYAGRMDRAEWMRTTTELEFRAIQRTRKFFEEAWCPWYGSRLPPTPKLWFVGLGDTYEEWISLYTDPTGYPESYWGRYYDDQIRPYVDACRRAAEEAGATSAGNGR